LSEISIAAKPSGSASQASFLRMARSKRGRSMSLIWAATFALSSSEPRNMAALLRISQVNKTSAQAAASPITPPMIPPTSTPIASITSDSGPLIIMALAMRSIRSCCCTRPYTTSLSASNAFAAPMINTTIVVSRA